MDPPTPDTPPRLAERLLGWLLPRDEWETPVGDFEEYYHVLVEVQGPEAARRWYWRQALGLIPDRFYQKLYWALVMQKNFFLVALRNLKKYRGPSLRYRFIESHRGHFTISAMCRVLEVSPSGYYDWRSRPQRANEKDNRLLREIRTIHAQSKWRYGSPRIHRVLRDRGICCSRKRVARLMQSHGIRAQPAGRHEQSA